MYRKVTDLGIGPNGEHAVLIVCQHEEVKACGGWFQRLGRWVRGNPTVYRCADCPTYWEQRVIPTPYFRIEIKA